MRLIRRLGKNRMAAQLHSEIPVLVLSLRSSKGGLGTRLALFTSKAVIKSFCQFSWKGAGHASSATVPSITALTRHTHRGSWQDWTIPSTDCQHAASKAHQVQASAHPLARPSCRWLKSTTECLRLLVIKSTAGVLAQNHCPLTPSTVNFSRVLHTLVSLDHGLQGNFSNLFKTMDHKRCLGSHLYHRLLGNFDSSY